MEIQDKLVQSNKNRSFASGSYDPGHNSGVSGQELLKNNLANLKKGEGRLMKYVKPLRSMAHDFLAFEVESSSRFRRGTHYLLSFVRENQADEILSNEVAMARGGASYKVPRNSLKSSFTCEVKVLTQKNAKRLEFEVDLDLSVGEMVQ